MRDYCINRNDFDHWGMLPHWKDQAAYGQWLKGRQGVRRRPIWEILGEKRGVDVVFEHPGETTIPTSILVCETGGMVTICAGTTDLMRRWICATTGCAKSGFKGRTLLTTIRPEGSTIWWLQAKSIRVCHEPSPTHNCRMPIS